MGRDRQSRRYLSPSCCAKDPLLDALHPLFVKPDLTNDPRLDPSVPHPVLNLVNDVVSYILSRQLVHKLRVVGLPIEASTHDHVDTRCLGDPAHRLREPADVLQHWIDQRSATGLPVESDLFGELHLVRDRHR